MKGKNPDPPFSVHLEESAPDVNKTGWEKISTSTGVYLSFELNFFSIVLVCSFIFFSVVFVKESRGGGGRGVLFTIYSNYSAG